MSRTMSLCSQRSACGRLIRILRWLVKMCVRRGVCGVMEMKLALDIAWIGCIGCKCGDELDAFTVLSSLSDYEDQSGDQEKSEKMKGRALACIACFLLWGRRMTYDGFFMDMKKGDLSALSFRERQGFQATKLIELLIKAARKGDPFAVFNLGVCYDYGECVLQDQQKAIEWYQKAADMNNSDAMVNLAVRYKKGDGVPQDEQKATELLQTAANLGNPHGMVDLGNCYDEGEGVSQDKQKAVELYQRASDMGNKNAMHNLAVCYENGDHVSQDKNKVIELDQRARSIGHKREMVMFVRPKQGFGVPFNNKAIVEVQKQFYSMGNSDATSTLIDYLNKRDGVSQDRSCAIEFYHRVTNEGKHFIYQVLLILKEKGNFFLL